MKRDLERGGDGNRKAGGSGQHGICSAFAGQGTQGGTTQFATSSLTQLPKDLWGPTQEVTEIWGSW